MIAEHVVDLEAHERLVRNGGYRPQGCLRCGGPMHIHEYRERLLLGDPRVSTDIAIFQCADRDACGAVTRVLPAFLARRLWRTWPTVEAAVAAPRAGADDVSGADKQDRPSAVPERTIRRWRTRLAASAAALVLVLGTATSTVSALHQVVQRVGLDGTRAQFVDVFVDVIVPEARSGARLETTASVIHRLAPGVRLM